jgi:hypothetical protein
MDDHDQVVKDTQQEIYRLRARLDRLRYELDALDRDLSEIVRAKPAAGRKTAQKQPKG